MLLYQDFVDPVTGMPLRWQNNQLIDEAGGQTYPAIKNIPRFTPLSSYANAFGSQWLAFSKTQLDSYTGYPISEDRLKQIGRGDFSFLKGKKVLEVGCGSGRFSEVLLKYGARLYAIDLSSAVEAQAENLAASYDYHLCQADVRALPFHQASFDVVVCVGVVQHTPDPEQTLAQLVSYLAPGGILLIDHYTVYPNPPQSKVSFKTRIVPRYWLRQLMLHMPAWATIRLCRLMGFLLWPLHRMAWKNRQRGWGRIFRKWLHVFSPMHDYHELYPFLPDKTLYQWSVLDTHDGLTDYYKYTRYKEEIESTLTTLGMTEVHAWYGGNGVEAFAIK